MPQLQNILTFIFLQDRSLAHFHREVRQSLNTVLPGRWIGRASDNDFTPMLWPRGPLQLRPVIISLGICQRLGIRPTIAM